jgi:hypothetical protein
MRRTARCGYPGLGGLWSTSGDGFRRSGDRCFCDDAESSAWDCGVDGRDGVERGVGGDAPAGRLYTAVGPNSKLLDTIGAGPLLGDVIRGFTSRATRLDWETGRREFGWQERFYDHVIRNERSLDAIREYLWDNRGNGRWILRIRRMPGVARRRVRGGCCDSAGSGVGGDAPPGRLYTGDDPEFRRSGLDR